MNELNGIEMIENEVDEAKIRVLVDYDPIVKSIVFRPVDSKFGTFYNVEVLLHGWDMPFKKRVDNDLVNFILLAQKLNKTAVAKKEFVKEENTEKEKVYTCAKITLTNGKVFRYFIGRADESSVELLYQDYLEKQVNQTDKNKK